MALATFKFEVPGDDFTLAGDASGRLKPILKKIGFDSDIVRRTTISMYEAEINMVIHAKGGVIDVEITTGTIKICCKDKGPGIEDIEKAMQEGYSTATDKVRSLGFGAGMGLPNIKKYADELKIETELGIGTSVYIVIKNQM